MAMAPSGSIASGSPCQTTHPQSASRQGQRPGRRTFQRTTPRSVDGRRSFPGLGSGCPPFSGVQTSARGGGQMEMCYLGSRLSGVDLDRSPVSGSGVVRRGAGCFVSAPAVSAFIIRKQDFLAPGEAWLAANPFAWVSPQLLFRAEGLSDPPAKALRILPSF